jgi:uncharacterized protein YqcC (DUF446 family)
VTDLAAVAAAADAIERSMRSVGWWTEEPPPEERMNFQAAFGADTLAFQEWLQWVLVPRVREGLAAGSLPHRSEVASYAVRELDGAPDADEVIQALMDLDAAING